MQRDAVGLDRHDEELAAIGLDEGRKNVSQILRSFPRERSPGEPITSITVGSAWLDRLTAYMYERHA